MTSHHDEGPTPHGPQNPQDPYGLQELRDRCDQLATMRRQQCVIADAMTGIALAVTEMVNNGEYVPTTHGSPEFVAEALRDGAHTAKLAASVLAAMERDAHRALNAVVQQN